MTLYKYVRDREAVLNIARGSLKFTPISDLNDPTELTPVMDRQAVRASLESLRETGYSSYQFTWLRRQGALLRTLAPQQMAIDVPRTAAEASRMLRHPVYNDLDRMETMLFAAAQDIRDRVGVLSLSERYDSLPMWAHYASQARGYVVIFDGLEQEFTGDNTGTLNTPRKVKYTRTFGGMTFDPATQNRLFFSKLIDWSYEREWRIVRALNQCRKSFDNALFLYDCCPGLVSGIICGWQARPEDLSNLRTELRKVNPAATLFSSVLIDGQITLTRNSEA